MLKNKVRRLEREVSEAGVRKRPPRRDVDAVAQRELEEARKEREREIQEVFEQKESLQREVFKVKETLQASQARVVAQTQEVQRNKDHIKSLLEKGDGDDELVDALRREVAALKDGGSATRRSKYLRGRRARSASPGAARRRSRAARSRTWRGSSATTRVSRSRSSTACLKLYLLIRRRPDEAPVYAGQGAVWFRRRAPPRRSRGPHARTPRYRPSPSLGLLRARMR